MKVDRNIILASASPTRQRLFTENLRIPFEVDVSNYEENLGLVEDPHALVQQLAAGKAREVATRHEDAIVIGADTILLHNGTPLGKPVDAQDARNTLHALSGTTHFLISGLCIIDTKNGKEKLDSEETKVHLRELSDEDIDAYVASGEPMGKAGSYEILSRGWYLIDKIEGDVFTIAGLPLARLAHDLKEFGVHIL